MVVDIISDLELDEDPCTDSMDSLATPERLGQIRLYLASYYLASAYGPLFLSLPLSPLYQPPPH